MTDLQMALKISGDIMRAKDEAIKNKTYKVSYVGLDGKVRNEYYHSMRWNDRPSSIGKYGK